MSSSRPKTPPHFSCPNCQHKTRMSEACNQDALQNCLNFRATACYSYLTVLFACCTLLAFTIPIFRTYFGSMTSKPPGKQGAMYIVSGMVAMILFVICGLTMMGLMAVVKNETTLEAGLEKQLAWEKEMQAWEDKVLAWTGRLVSLEKELWTQKEEIMVMGAELGG